MERLPQAKSFYPSFAKEAQKAEINARVARHLESDLTPGDGEGQGSLVCSSPPAHKEWDTDEWLN